MRGKERFSAPRNSLDSIMRFSAGDAMAVLYGLSGCGKLALYQGPTLKSGPWSFYIIRAKRLIFRPKKLLWMLCFGFVSGHDFKSCRKGQKENWASAPAMAKSARNASSEAILSRSWVFFATTKTSMARRILQSDRNALLLTEVLRWNVAAGRFQLHDFVIMPDHLHLLMTVPSDMTIEKAMQLVRGGFPTV